MPDSSVTCRVCGCELEGREVYEGICTACHEDEVLGKTAKPGPRKPLPRKKAAPVAPPVDMEADTREIEPLPDPDPSLPIPEPPPPVPDMAADEDISIALDSAEADEEEADVLPLQSAPSPETEEPEMLSLISSSPAMEIPRDALPRLPLDPEPELPLDVEDDDELRIEEEEAGQDEASDAQEADTAEETGHEPPLEFQRDPTLVLPSQAASAPHPEARGPEPLVLAASPEGSPFPAIERQTGRLNALQDRVERLERLLNTRNGTFRGGLKTGVGFLFGAAVGLALLAGLTAAVGATVYPPALEWLKSLLP